MILGILQWVGIVVALFGLLVMAGASWESYK